MTKITSNKGSANLNMALSVEKPSDVVTDRQGFGGFSLKFGLPTREAIELPLMGSFGGEGLFRGELNSRSHLSVVRLQVGDDPVQIGGDAGDGATATEEGADFSQHGGLCGLELGLLATKSGVIPALAEGEEAGEGIAQAIGRLVHRLARFIGGLAELGLGLGIDEIGPQLVGDELEAFAEAGERSAAPHPFQDAFVDLTSLLQALQRFTETEITVGRKKFPGEIGIDLEAAGELRIHTGDDDDTSTTEIDQIPGLECPPQRDLEILGRIGDLRIRELRDFDIGILGLHFLDRFVFGSVDRPPIVGATVHGVGNHFLIDGVESILALTRGDKASLRHGFIELIRLGQRPLLWAQCGQPIDVNLLLMSLEPALERAIISSLLGDLVALALALGDAGGFSKRALANLGMASWLTLALSMLSGGSEPDLHAMGGRGDENTFGRFSAATFGGGGWTFLGGDGIVRTHGTMMQGKEIEKTG